MVLHLKEIAQCGGGGGVNAEEVSDVVLLGNFQTIRVATAPIPHLSAC